MKFINMFKKLVLPLASIPLLFSCSIFGTSATTDASIGSMYIEKATATDSYIEINSATLEEMLAHQSAGHKYDFVLFVTQSGCGGCAIAKEYIEQLVAETDFKVYGIDASLYKATYLKDLYNIPALGGTPTLFFFTDGEAVKTMAGVSDSYDEFKSEFTSTIKYTSASSYDLNDYVSSTAKDGDDEYKYNTYSPDTTETLDYVIANTENITVLFTWSLCGDCASMYDSFFIDYMNEDSNKDFYSFDVNALRINKPVSEPEDKESQAYQDWLTWINFADKYGLSNYKDGKVPAFINFVNGKFSSMVVYRNEGEATENEDGTFSYLGAYNSSVKEIKADNLNDLKVKANVQEIKLVKEIC